MLVTYPAPARVSREVKEQTNQVVKVIAFIGAFNNAVYVHRNGGVYTIHASAFAAQGIARAGFDVTHRGGNVYTFIRSRTTYFE